VSREGGRLDVVRAIGPGLAIAATGVGAGDLIAAAAAGSRFGHTLIWAAVVGAVLKFVLNEGLARWQLATGTTLLEGWATHLGAPVRYAFLVYLSVWSFVVGGALVSACGLAAHALVPALPVWAWGIVHSLVGALVVLWGGYGPFERLIKVFIAVMFFTLVGCAILIEPPARSVALAVTEAAVPPGGLAYVMGVIGGVGGSVTLLSYGYWIREKGWEGPAALRRVRVDLAVAYGLTGVFAVAVMILAAATLHAEGVILAGGDSGSRMADMVGGVLGGGWRRLFLIGFWGAVATSLLGVWQGVPYMFADFVGLAGHSAANVARVDPSSLAYRAFLAFLAGPPLLTLAIGRPVALVVVYAVLGSMFMPFLAATLLYMNSRTAWVGGRLRNGRLTILLLVLCLALFGYLLILKVIDIS
jgi:Mn2+/Fe2+ NRAMP family transporter